MQARKYVDQIGSNAMLAVKRLAGVAPEVNLRNPLYAGHEACKPGINPGFENQGNCHQKSETGYQWPYKRTDALQKFEKMAKYSRYLVYKQSILSGIRVKRKLDTVLC